MFRIAFRQYSVAFSRDIFVFTVRLLRSWGIFFFRFFIIVQVNYIIAVNKVSFFSPSLVNCPSDVISFLSHAIELHEGKITCYRHLTRAFLLALTAIQVKFLGIARLFSAVRHIVKETVCSINSVKKVLTITFEFYLPDRNTDFNKDVAYATLFFLISAIFFWPKQSAISLYLLTVLPHFNALRSKWIKLVNL